MNHPSISLWFPTPILEHWRPVGRRAKKDDVDVVQTERESRTQTLNETLCGESIPVSWNKY